MKVNIYSYKHNEDKPGLHIKRYLIILPGVDIKDLDHYYELENTCDYREFKRNIELKLWNSYVAIPDMDKLFKDLEEKGFHTIKSEISSPMKSYERKSTIEETISEKFDNMNKKIDTLEKKLENIHDIVMDIYDKIYESKLGG